MTEFENIVIGKNRTRENAVLYGIGQGGIEILAVILPAIITCLVIAITFSKGTVEARKGYLPLAIILHMLMDLFAALYQRGMVPLWTVEAWAAFWTAVICFVAVRLYRKMKDHPMG